MIWLRLPSSRISASSYAANGAGSRSSVVNEEAVHRIRCGYLIGAAAHFSYSSRTDRHSGSRAKVGQADAARIAAARTIGRSGFIDGTLSREGDRVPTRAEECAAQRLRFTEWQAFTCAAAYSAGGALRGRRGQSRGPA